MISYLTSSEQFHDILAGEELVLIDFYATWCEPCKWLDTILDDVANRFTHRLHILKIDSEKLPDLAQLHEIRSVPVLLIFKNNRLIWRMNGFLTADEMIEKLTAISRGTR